MKKKSNKIILTLVFILLVVITLLVIVNQNESFSLKGFIQYVSDASLLWIILAFICMLGFVFFEAWAIRILSEAFGYRRSMKKALVYSASDIYFSAITPSATGGQPASALFMMKDKIPGAVTTIILLINLTLYTTSIIVIGGICFITRSDIFIDLSALSKCLVLIGYGLQFVLLAVFLLLVFKEKIVMKIATIVLRLLHKIHIVRHIDKKLEHLEEVEKQYKECAKAIKQHKKSMLQAFICNLLQRLSLVCVSVCVFIGVTDSVSGAYTAFATQGYVVMGSNSVPIPGAVGAADYLFIDGFDTLVQDPISIELLSRGISFYCCIIVCGLLTLGAYLTKGLKGIKQRKKC